MVLRLYSKQSAALCVEEPHHQYWGHHLAIVGDEFFPFPVASLEDNSVQKQFELAMSLNSCVLFVSELHEDLFALIPLSQVSVQEDLA